MEGKWKEKGTDRMILKDIWLDVKAVQERDPAARNALEVLLLYQGVHALIWHRFAHWFYKHKMFFAARLISQIARFFTLIEIHPGAQLGHGILIDHGCGVVIGETTVVGDNCTIYQGVTLGGVGLNKGKRHPTLGSNVTVGAGAKILGSFEVGDNCTIAANAVLLKPLQDNVTAVGVPARAVKIDGVPIPKKEKNLVTMDHYCKMEERIRQMQEILRHGKMKFGLHFLVMDPGYHPANRQLIEENAALMEIPIEIFDSDIFDVVVDVDESPCYLCARMRRGFLYAHAKELGCNKIALGHHFDDVIETVLMSMLYGGQVNTMMPKLHSTNFEGMELLRPLYFVKERAIIDWKEENGLHFLQCACRFTEAIAKERAMRAESAVSDGMAGGDIVHSSKRQEMKELIEEFRKINPNIENNIFKSVTNVNLDACIGYVKNGERHHFLDEY